MRTVRSLEDWIVRCEAFWNVNISHSVKHNVHLWFYVHFYNKHLWPQRSSGTCIQITSAFSFYSLTQGVEHVLTDFWRPWANLMSTIWLYTQYHDHLWSWWPSLFCVSVLIFISGVSSIWTAWVHKDCRSWAKGWITKRKGNFSPFFSDVFWHGYLCYFRCVRHVHPSNLVSSVLYYK